MNVKYLYLIFDLIYNIKEGVQGIYIYFQKYMYVLFII